MVPLLYMFPLLPVLVLFLFISYGTIQNVGIEIAVAVFVVGFYIYLQQPLVGIIALTVAFFWFLYRYYIYRVNYNIPQLNAVSISGQIPKRIIQIYSAGKTSHYDSKYIPLIKSVKSLNPECEYMFFDDEAIDSFLTNYYPEYISTYKSLPNLIQRVDFFRYLAIYHYGGLYLDLDIRGLKPLDDAFFSHSCLFPIDEYLSEPMKRWPRYRPFLNQGCAFLLGQYAFAAEPKHPFLWYLVNQIHSHCQATVAEYEKRKPMRKQEREWFVYRTTGPDFVTTCYMQYWNKSQIFILNNGKRQHLGKYAKHEYFGTWK